MRYLGVSVISVALFGMVLSGAVSATIPIVIVYVIFQRRIIKGVTLTGMGGR